MSASHPYYKSFWILLFAFLASCGQQTAKASIGTPAPAVTLPATTPTSAAALPTATPTPTSIPLFVTPSPPPTEPVVPIITPDAIQVERWRDYEDALAKSLLPNLPRDDVLCEWEILGQSDVEVYIWAKCQSVTSKGIYSDGTDIYFQLTTPAVLYLGPNGAIQDLKFPGAGTHYAPDIRDLFPIEVQERIFNHLVNLRQLAEHIEMRRTYPDMPPLIVFLATPTPPPTEPVVPIITPDAIQVERWRDYEDALAMVYLPPNPLQGEVLCEWEILGQSDQQVFVWAFCQSPPYSEDLPPTIASMPAVVNLGRDGTVLSVEVPKSGTSYAPDIKRMFPVDVQERIFTGSVYIEQMKTHVELRREREIPGPPLIVLLATPIP